MREICQMGACVMHRHGLPPPRRLNGKPYGLSHPYHPMTVWLGDDRENMKYAVAIGLACWDEHEYRLRYQHGCLDALCHLADQLENLPRGKQHLPPLCVSDDLKHCASDMDDVIDTYRAYYIDTKRHLFRFTRRQPPSWLQLEDQNNGTYPQASR